MHLRDLTQFLTELSDNNNRPWFIHNKPRYDILREEFETVVTELIAAIARFDPQVVACNPKKAMFRINRDIRFSHDKRPYKTRFSAGITPRDLRRPSAGGGPTYYFHIDGDGTLGIGAGEYLPPAERLKAIRAQIVADAAGFGKLVNNKGMRATFGDMETEHKLQRPPKGYDPAHPHIDYLKLKGFFVWTELKLERNSPEKLVPQLARAYQDAFALVRWLRAVEVAPAED
jgi:uncharacterized protein (TIGR02453 family)